MGLEWFNVLAAMKNMKTSVYKYKLLVVFSILIMQMFFYGCMGSGGSSSDDSEDVLESSDPMYTISGRVLQTDTSANIKEWITTPTAESSRPPLTLNDGLVRKQSSLEQITVRLAQQSSIYTLCDEEGYFKLYVPKKIYQSVNIIAYKGFLNTESFCIQKSDDIILSDETFVNAGKIYLSQGKNTLSIRLKDKYNNPIRYAACFFWGFELISDMNGNLTFPLFPENIKNVTSTISAAGFKEFTNDFPVLTKDLGPVNEVVLRSSEENKAPVIINFDPFDSEPNPEQQVSLSVSVTDASRVLGNSYSVKWTSTDGKFLKTDERSTTIWQAPSYIGLATITAKIFVEGYESSASIGLAVGKSRTVNSKISSFSPNKATAGQTLTINGMGFGLNKGEVNFVGGGAQVLSWSDNQIVVLVPDSVATGKITVKTGNKVLTSEEEFIVMNFDISLSVNYGVPGTEVSITGYGFGDTKDDNSELLYYGEKINNIIYWSNQLIKFKVEDLNDTVPPIANLELVIRGRKFYLGEFIISNIKSISPEEVDLESESGKILITINGLGFGELDESETAKNSVKFLINGEDNIEDYVDAEVSFWSDDKIEVYLPSRAKTGNILLIINGYEIQGPILTIISGEEAKN